MIDLTNIERVDEEGIWIYFNSDNQCVDLGQFGSICIHLSELINEITDRLAPGSGVRVTLHEVEPGSIKALIKFSKDVGGFLKSPEGVGSMIIGSIFFILAILIDGDSGDTIIHLPDGTTEIEIDGKKIKIRKHDVDEAEKIKDNKDVKVKVKKLIDAVDKSVDTNGIGILQTDLDGHEETAVFGPKDVAVLNEKLDIDLNEIAEKTVKIHANAVLEIIKAILQKSERRWQFKWMNRFIPAPILDDDFYEKMYAHEIELGPGDTIEADLRIHQKYDRDTGTFTPERYEVIKVHRYNSWKEDKNDFA